MLYALTEQQIKHTIASGVFDALHRALLQRMAPEHKFATAAKLCGEVLGGVADGLLPLGQCEEVLGDALRCLASKDIKVTVEILSTLSTRA